MWTHVGLLRPRDPLWLASVMVSYEKHHVGVVEKPGLVLMEVEPVGDLRLLTPSALTSSLSNGQRTTSLLVQLKAFRKPMRS